MWLLAFSLECLFTATKQTKVGGGCYRQLGWSIGWRMQRCGISSERWSSVWCQWKIGRHQCSWWNYWIMRGGDVENIPEQNCHFQMRSWERMCVCVWIVCLPSGLKLCQMYQNVVKWCNYSPFLILFYEQHTCICFCHMLMVGSQIGFKRKSWGYILSVSVLRAIRQQLLTSILASSSLHV